MDDCMLASERANAARERIVAWCREQGLTAYDRRSGEGLLRNLVVREGRRSGAIQVRLVTSPGEIDRDSLIRAGAGLDGLLWTRVDSVAETTYGGETELLAGSDRFEEVLGGMRFEISAEAFFQTNTEMAERLYELAIEYAAPIGFERVYDLYCGIGTIGLLIVTAGGRGVGAGAGARGDRRRDRQRARQRGRQRPLLRRRRAPGHARAGGARRASRRARSSIRRARGCRRRWCGGSSRRRRRGSSTCRATRRRSPRTRRSWSRPGTSCVRVRPVDMFPQTPHIECVAELVRRSGRVSAHARRHHHRQATDRRGASGPRPRSRRGAGRGARRRAQRRRHAAARAGTTRRLPARRRTSRGSSSPARWWTAARAPSASQMGDRVMSIVGGGGQAELATVHERILMPVPETSPGPRPAVCPRCSPPRTTRCSPRPGCVVGERLLVHGARGRRGLRGGPARSRRRCAGDRHRAQRRSARRGGRVRRRR